MKILIISYYFPPCTDGAATLMHNLCKYLPKECFNVITTKKELGIYCWDNLGAYDKEYVLDCSTIRLPVKTNKTLDRIKFFLLAVLWGLLLNKKGEVDCLLAVYPDEFDLFTAYFLHQLTRKPLLVYMHDLYSEVRKKACLYGIWKSAERMIFSSASAILVTNEKFKDHYSSRGIKNVIVFHSCVDLSGNNYRALSQSQRSVKRRLKIVFTGSVYGANEDAILCFLKAAKKISDIEVIFSTHHKSGYLKEVSIGFLPKKECFKLQRNADVLFLPLSFKYLSRDEIRCAFPCKVLEYLAASKPILAVVPKGSFMEEFIKKYKVGLVVTVLSEEKVIDAINKLKDERIREKISKNASKTVLLFDARVQSKRLFSIAEDVVLNRSLKGQEKEA